MSVYVAKYDVEEPYSTWGSSYHQHFDVAVYTRIIDAEDEANALQKAREIRSSICDSFTRSVTLKSLKPKIPPSDIDLKKS